MTFNMERLSTENHFWSEIGMSYRIEMAIHNEVVLLPHGAEWFCFTEFEDAPIIIEFKEEGHRIMVHFLEDDMCALQTLGYTTNEFSFKPKYEFFNNLFKVARMIA